MLSRDVENTMTLALQDRTTSSAEKYRTTLAAVSRTVRMFPQSNELKREMFATLLGVFCIGLFLVIAQLVFLTVFFSHKVAGPIHRFKLALQECINGRYTDFVKLRRDDEMQKFADLFNTAQQATRQRLFDLIHAESDEKRKAIASTLQL
jgi:nitrate/nitrite-specific signal transduction histidine kinase